MPPPAARLLPAPITNGLFVAGTLVAAQATIALMESAIKMDCNGEYQPTRSMALTKSAYTDGQIDAVLLGPALSLLYMLKHVAVTPFTL
jgi:hypothetical protein